MTGYVMDPREVTAPNLLVGEGRDEEFFFEALCDHLGLRTIQVLPFGGKTQLHQNLKALVRTPGFSQVSSLGVVRDADGDPMAAFQSVCGALSGAGLHVPSEAFVHEGHNPRVGVMILPGADRVGMLEDLCIEAVQDHPAAECVEAFFECLQQHVQQMPGNLAKAKTHAFLASLPEPDKRLGEAAKAGYWPFAHDRFQHVSAFLRRMAR
jgi:hypothetical protein